MRCVHLHERPKAGDSFRVLIKACSRFRHGFKGPDLPSLVYTSGLVEKRSNFLASNVLGLVF